MDSLRFVICGWCGQVFFLCRWCDDGDRYCTRACAATGRRESLRAAGRRYQRTEAGRAHHAARQQRYLDKREVAKMTHQTARSVAEAVEVLAPDPVSTRDASTEIREGDETRVLATAGPKDTVLKARLSATAHHPRALPTLLEALALWQGIPVHAVVVAGNDPADSSVTGLKLDYMADFEGAPLYTLEFVGRHKPRHRDLLDGMGAFHDLRQLLMFEGPK